MSQNKNQLDLSKFFYSWIPNTSINFWFLSKLVYVKSNEIPESHTDGSNTSSSFLCSIISYCLNIDTKHIGYWKSIWINIFDQHISVSIFWINMFLYQYIGSICFCINIPLPSISFSFQRSVTDQFVSVIVLWITVFWYQYFGSTLIWICFILI